LDFVDRPANWNCLLVLKEKRSREKILWPFFSPEEKKENKDGKPQLLQPQSMEFNFLFFVCFHIL